MPALLRSARFGPTTKEADNPMALEIFTDGGARGNPGPAAAGVVIRDEQGRSILEAGYYLGNATNNVAEYTAMLMALEAAVGFGADEIVLYADSELMVKQLTGEYQVKNAKLAELFEQAQRLLIRFDSWQVKHVRRAENKQADALVNKALDAKRNIVEFQLGDARPEDRPEPADAAGQSPTAAPARRTDPAQAPANTADTAGGEVIVKVVRAPIRGGCLAGMRQGQEFTFAETVPAGLCIYAAKAAIDTVLAMRHAAAEDETPDPVRVRCGKPGCGAEFEVRISSGQGGSQQAHLF